MRERRRFRESLQRFHQQGQSRPGCECVWVVRAEVALADRQGLALQRFGLLRMPARKLRTARKIQGSGHCQGNGAALLVPQGQEVSGQLFGTFDIEDAQALVEGQAAGIAMVDDVLAVNVLQGRERTSFGVAAGIDQTRDVRVIESGEDLALGLEAPPQDRAIETGMHQLDRDVALVGAVGAAGQPHRTHATAANLAFQPPAPEHLSLQLSVLGAFFAVEQILDQLTGLVGQLGRCVSGLGIRRQQLRDILGQDRIGVGELREALRPRLVFQVDEEFELPARVPPTVGVHVARRA